MFHWFFRKFGKQIDELDLYKEELDRLSHLNLEKYFESDNLIPLKEILIIISKRYKREEIDLLIQIINKIHLKQDLEDSFKSQITDLLKKEFKIFSFDFSIIRLYLISKHILYFKQKNLNVENLNKCLSDLKMLSQFSSVFSNILEIKNLKDYFSSHPNSLNLDTELVQILENLVCELERHHFKIN